VFILELKFCTELAWVHQKGEKAMAIALVTGTSSGIGLATDPDFRESKAIARQ
jgi:hypothetical protein